MSHSKGIGTRGETVGRPERGQLDLDGGSSRANGEAAPDPVDAELREKKETVFRHLRAAGSVVVAFSGGIDSAVLLGLAVRALGAGKVVAVTGRSASLAEQDAADARRVAAALGVAHEEVLTREAEVEAYRANSGDRCYHCRRELFSALSVMARERGFAAIAYGAIADDLSDDRPGMRAASEAGVLAPLLEAGMTKRDIRALAAELDLDIREKPAGACLASRIPSGVEVTPERLAQVGRAESSLREIGLTHLRVRHHGEIARIELGPQDLAKMSDPVVRGEVARRVRAAGFRFATLDLEGYRTGGGGLVSVDPPRSGERR